MEYTRSQCKEDMITLWKELARTGANSKSRILFTLNHDFYKHIFDMPFACPCCKLVNHLDNDENCHECPIDWKSIPIYKTAHCTVGKSPYNSWTKARTKLERQYYANRILILAYMIRI